MDTITLDEMVAYLVVLGSIALLIFAAGIAADRRGYKRGIREGRKQGVEERETLQSSLTRLEGLARTLQTQLDSAGKDAAVETIRTNDAEVKAERDNNAARAAGIEEGLRTASSDGRYSKSYDDLPPLLTTDAAVPAPGSAGAEVEVDLPPTLQDDDSRVLGDAIDTFQPLEPVQTERVEDPAKPGDIGYGSEPHHG